MRKIALAAIEAIKNPVESVLFTYSIGLLVFSLYLISPFYGHVPGSTIWMIVPEKTAETVVGFLFLLSSLPGLLAPFRPSRLRARMAKRAAFMSFLSFLFLAILRILLYGWLPLTWMPLLMISISSGILRVFLEVQQK